MVDNRGYIVGVRRFETSYLFLYPLHSTKLELHYAMVFNYCDFADVNHHKIALKNWGESSPLLKYTSN